MSISARFTRPRKSLVGGIFAVALASLVVGWTAGTGAASSHSTVPSATPQSSSAVAMGVPGPGTTTNLPRAAGDAVSSGGTSAAIAYPIPGYNSLGVAPEGTVLAQGTGTADMKVNGSDKAAALKKATDAALADAHSQALAAATSMGVQLGPIYSVSIVSNMSYVYPMTDCGIVAPALPANGAAGSAGSAGTSPASPPAVCKEVAPTSTQLVVTLIVAYKYG